MDENNRYDCADPCGHWCAELGADWFFRLRFGDNPFSWQSVLGGKGDFCSGGAFRLVVFDLLPCHWAGATEDEDKAVTKGTGECFARFTYKGCRRKRSEDDAFYENAGLRK